jgi:LmbE family N-acetylglucosaminyl deacetylase
VPNDDCVVFFHAHPDDEAIFTGGTMLRLAEEGRRTALVVATSGEMGLRPDGAPPSELGARRRAETQAACDLLAVDRLAFLDYLDSGTAGDPANHAPGAFFMADTAEAAGRLAAILDDVGASHLVVYDAGGIYGHPDHIQVHRVGVAAARLAGIETVYQATVDREYLHFVETHLVEHAHDPVTGPPAIGVASVMVTTMVDVTRHLDRKRAAIGVHTSQVPEHVLDDLVPHASFAAVYGFEWYVREGPPGPIDALG